jgi:hypothetical protein
MKTTYTDEQLQAAIDAAFPAGAREDECRLDINPEDSEWESEAPNRLSCEGGRAMTQEEKRIKLAEADGWKPNGAGYWHKNGEVCALQFESLDGRGNDVYPLPNYFHDLNAVHELEKVLDEKQQDIMNNTLWDIMSGRKYLWHATATQRAEALGLTLGLWEDAQ